MLNSGAIRRVGPNRMWVELCRHWAAKGIPTLRLDLEGIGDSDGDAARITRLYPSVMYTEERIGQAIAAIDMLEQRGLGNRFMLSGLCSGAYWSFHAACRDERVSAVFLINPRILFWDRLIQTERDNRRKVLRTSQWPRMLRGEVPLARAISLLGHALVMMPRQALAGKRARQSRSAALDGALDHLRDTDKSVQVFFSGDEPLREELEIEKRLSHLRAVSQRSHPLYAGLKSYSTSLRGTGVGDRYVQPGDWRRDPAHLRGQATRPSATSLRP